MKNNQPLVSVFIPYYNDAKYLRKSIESVLNQTYQNIELILINHATTDNCCEIAHSYTDDRIKHIDMPRNEGGGGGLIFEAMLKAASGKYIKPLCADDMMKPDCLEILVNYMESHPKIDFAFGDVEYVDKNDKDLKNSWFKQRQGFDINDTEADLIRKYSNGIAVLPYISNISKREIFDNIEINKSFVMMFDISLWLQLLCNGYKIGLVNKIVCNYRIHDEQMSAANKEALAGYVCWFEGCTFYMYLMKINNVALAKSVFPDSIYAKKLKNVSDIPFFIAYEMFNKYKPVFDIPLTNMLNDDEYREHLMKTFGFGVKEFRELRKSDFCINPPVLQKGFKTKVYWSKTQDVNIVGLVFLILRRIFKFVTLDKFRHKSKKKYSL